VGLSIWGRVIKGGYEKKKRKRKKKKKKGGVG